MTIVGYSGIGRAVLVGVTAAWVLAGCASTAPHATRSIAPNATPPASVPWEQRLPALQAIASFQIEGKIAATDGKQGFSAGLRWHQQGDAATIDLSAPLGFGAAHIEQGADGLTVTTAQGATYRSGAASDQLAATLGFEPPLGSLRFWVLGASDPALPAQESVDDQQRLAHLDQDGWHVDCEDYALVNQQWLPRRLLVTRQALRLKLIVNTWRL
jgi:outer membrane lipoprotein LolB